MISYSYLRPCQRAHPVAKRASSRSTQRPAPTVVPAGKWQHDRSDLFKEGSNLYRPQLAATVSFDQASPSLRPFGVATPSVIPVAAAAAPLRPASAPPTGPRAATNLASRLGIKGEANENKRREQERRARMDQEREEKRRGDAAKREEQARQRELAEQLAAQRKIAEEEDKGSVVQVEGLVFGTSAEDVQVRTASAGAVQARTLTHMLTRRRVPLFADRVQRIWRYQLLLHRESAHR